MVSAVPLPRARLDSSVLMQEVPLSAVSAASAAVPGASPLGSLGPVVVGAPASAASVPVPRAARAQPKPRQAGTPRAPAPASSPAPAGALGGNHGHAPGLPGSPGRETARGRAFWSTAVNRPFDQPSAAQRVIGVFRGFDLPLLLAVALLAGGGLLTMYSVGYDHGTRFVDHGRNMVIAATLLFVVAQFPPQRLMQLAVPLYAVGVALLVATALFGLTKKGATRWLDLQVTVIQPSEMLKLATPLMLAWWFQRREGQLTIADFIVALALLAVPVGLIMKQPDLGTSLLVLAAGMYVIFFAGLSWWLIIPVLLIGAGAVGAVIYYEPVLCQPDVVWPGLREYQKTRVCTLLDPTKDPLGKGFHIIQGMIAIGSGGIYGKGFMQGTQTHLEFIPERTTDFAFAALGEEFGLVGGLHAAGGLRGADPARADDRRRGANAVHAPAGRGDHAELLHLLLREHGHGQRHPAGGGRAAALHQLWRHRDGDDRREPGHPDVDLEEPADDSELRVRLDH